MNKLVLIFAFIFFSSSSFGLKKIVNRVSEKNPNTNIKRDFFQFYPKLTNCNGRFGYEIVSEMGRYEYLYIDEGKDLECEEYDALAKVAGQEAEAEKQKLLELFKSSKTIDTCIDLENEKEYFLRHYKSIISRNANELARELQDIDDNKSHNIQDIHNAKAFYGSMCAAGATTRDISHFVVLGNILSGVGSRGESRVVQTDGETIESCLDVKAYGDGSIKGFQVKVENLASPYITLSYDHFKISDALTVKLGSKVLASTGCASGGKTKVFKFPASKGILSVEIDGNCSSDDDSSNTAWYFRLQCNKKPDELLNESLGSEVCYSLIDKYDAQINKIIQKNNAILNTYWAQAKCYAKAHGKLVSDFFGSDEDFMPSFLTDDERLVSLMQRESQEFIKDDLKIEKNQESLAKPSHSPLFPAYKDFKLNRFKYCGKRPPKEQSLFKTISFAYCFYGYLRLFDEENPIFD